MQLDGNCTGLATGVAVSWAFASATTTKLFLLRVRALYRNNTLVVGLFVFFWLCGVGGALALPLSLGNHVGARLITNQPIEIYCVNLDDAFPAYAGLSLIIPAIYDTIVFGVISYCLYPDYDLDAGVGWKERVSLFFTGKGLPKLSRALLQSGQRYYL